MLLNLRLLRSWLPMYRPNSFMRPFFARHPGSFVWPVQLARFTTSAQCRNGSSSADVAVSHTSAWDTAPGAGSNVHWPQSQDTRLILWILKIIHATNNTNTRAHTNTNTNTHTYTHTTRVPTCTHKPVRTHVGTHKRNYAHTQHARTHTCTHDVRIRTAMYKETEYKMHHRLITVTNTIWRWCIYNNVYCRHKLLQESSSDNT